MRLYLPESKTDKLKCHKIDKQIYYYLVINNIHKNLFLHFINENIMVSVDTWAKPKSISDRYPVLDQNEHQKLHFSYQVSY